MVNTMSIYPDGIDPMLFFQDNDLENLEIMNIYNTFISQGKYEEANTFLSQQEDLHGYFADYFNAIEHRIERLHEHVLSKGKISPFILFESGDADKEPPSTLEGTIWI